MHSQLLCMALYIKKSNILYSRAAQVIFAKYLLRQGFINAFINAFCTCAHVQTNRYMYMYISLDYLILSYLYHCKSDEIIY